MDHMNGPMDHMNGPMDQMNGPMDQMNGRPCTAAHRMGPNELSKALTGLAIWHAATPPWLRSEREQKARGVDVSATMRAIDAVRGDGGKADELV